MAALWTNLVGVMTPDWRASSVQGGVGASSLLCRVRVAQMRLPAADPWRFTGTAVWGMADEARWRDNERRMADGGRTSRRMADELRLDAPARNHLSLASGVDERVCACAVGGKMPKWSAGRWRSGSARAPDLGERNDDPQCEFHPVSQSSETTLSCFTMVKRFLSLSYAFHANILFLLSWRPI